MIRFYGKMECPYCGKIVTMNGFGKISHFRKHVREGLLVERKDFKNRCLFVLVDDLEKDDIFHEYLKKES